MKDWYKKSFDLNYLEIYSHRDELDALKVVDFIERHLPLEKKHLILDLCCGSGRHSILLLDRGYKCVGLDLSDKLLRNAKDTIDSTKRNFPIVRADMRRIPFHNRFDVVLNLFTSFGYFERDDDNFEVIESVSEALKKDGCFVLDYLNKDYVITNLTPHSSRELKSGWILTEERKLVSESNIIKKRIKLSRNRSIDEYLEILKVYSIDEIEEMLSRVGLSIIEVFGNFDGEKYSEKYSERLIIFSKKTGEF